MRNVSTVVLGLLVGLVGAWFVACAIAQVWWP